MLQVNKRISFYKNKVVRDDEIMLAFGVTTYNYLVILYPYLFEAYKECNQIIKIHEGHIPSWINMYIDDPFEFKKDIILYLCGENLESNVKYLIDTSSKPKLPLIQEDGFYSWIFICIVMIILILISIYVIILS